MEEYRIKKNKRSRNVGDDLFFRAASSQVFSAQVSLTSVFGMGTGGPSPWKSPTILLALVKEHHVLLVSLKEIYISFGDWCWHWPIFPGRFQPSIFGADELNFCVRNGNRWTLIVKNTNYYEHFKCSLKTEQRKVRTKWNSSYRRTWNLVVQALDRLVSLSCIHYCTSTCDLSTS